MSKHINDLMCKDTPRVMSKDRLLSFLYLLMRDYLPTGAVAELVNDSLDNKEDSIYCNGHLAEHSKYLSELLKPDYMKHIDARILNYECLLSDIESAPISDVLLLILEELKLLKNIIEVQEALNKTV